MIPEFVVPDLTDFEVMTIFSLRVLGQHGNIAEIRDVANSKQRHGLNEILIFFLPALHLGNQQSCLQQNSVMQYIHKTWRDLVRSAWVCYNCTRGFHAVYTWHSFLVNDFADFPEVRVKNVDFVQSLVVFGMSNICYFLHNHTLSHVFHNSLFKIGLCFLKWEFFFVISRGIWWCVTLFLRMTAFHNSLFKSGLSFLKWEFFFVISRGIWWCVTLFLRMTAMFSYLFKV